MSMHLSKELRFTYEMMPTSLRYMFSLNRTLQPSVFGSLHTTGLFSYCRIIIMFVSKTKHSSLTTL